jgi:hypothetical protein
MKRSLIVVGIWPLLALAETQTPDPPGHVLTVVRPNTPYMPGGSGVGEFSIQGAPITYQGTWIFNPQFKCPDGYARVLVEGSQLKCAPSDALIDGTK